MKVLFVGGPRDSTTMEVPELSPTLLIPIPRSPSTTAAVPNTDLTHTPIQRVCVYEFTHQATVDITGRVLAVIYIFKDVM